MLTTILLFAMIATQGDVQATIYDEPCEGLPQWKRAVVKYQGVEHRSCWRLIPFTPTVRIVMEGGEVAQTHFANFKSIE